MTKNHKSGMIRMLPEEKHILLKKSKPAQYHMTIIPLLLQGSLLRGCD